jgi:hypothetical protein
VIWEQIFCGTRAPYLRAGSAFLLLALFCNAAHGREKDVLQYGAGLIVNVPYPEAEVAQVVQDVAQNTIIRGTKEYNKDEFVSGAVEAKSTPVFTAWTENGKVFYKVRKQALNPINFKNSNDVGTLAVRYIVQPQGDKNTVLRLDAIFVEDFRHGIHQSNGSVESSEYKDIQDRLEAVELLKKETAEALRQKEEHATKKKLGLANDEDQGSSSSLSTKLADDTPAQSGSAKSAERAPVHDSQTSTDTVQDSARTPESLAADDVARMPLEQRVAYLRQQVSRSVKQPGAPLKSAPFHTASTLKSLDPDVEVLILIATPYWYGVETHDGQHGWLRRDQVEQVQ